MSGPESSDAEPEAHAPAHRLASATLFCENCGTSTPHRILRIDGRGAGPGRPIRGIARCRTCHFTHPFESAGEDHVDISLIVSSGASSERERLRLPRFRTIQVGTGVPDTDRALTVRRIDVRTGRSVPSARAGEVATVWASRDEGAVVLVSIVEGRRTRSDRLRLPHRTQIAVGDELLTSVGPIEVVGLRARGRTWRRPGDAFPADEVDRVYGRRTASPPAGRSDWRRGRDSPSSRERLVSTASRSRSSPGTRRTRREPRARTAEGGAAVHSDVPR